MEGDNVDGQPDGFHEEEVRRNADGSSDNADQRSARQGSSSSGECEATKGLEGGGGEGLEGRGDECEPTPD